MLIVWNAIYFFRDLFNLSVEKSRLLNIALFYKFYRSEAHWNSRHVLALSFQKCLFSLNIHFDVIVSVKDNS